MQKISLALLSLFFLALTTVQAQTPVASPANPDQPSAVPIYRMLIKGGRVLDPKNNINELLDVAIQDGKIALVRRDIDEKLASQVVDAKGLYVTPGLIDMHTHVFAGTQPDHYLSNGLVAVFPDAANLKSGVTTVVDAGGAGYKSFNIFKTNIIDHSITRVLSFINIVGEGMRGGAYEQDIADMDAKKADSVAKANKQYVVGFKLAHFRGADWTPVERVLEAGKLSNLPVMIDFGGDGTHQPLSLEELFTKHLRSGDIFTHTFTELPFRESIVDVETRQLKPFIIPAQKKGIIFDVGFGGGSLDLRQAQPAIRAGFYPNTLGTDLHAESVLGAMKDQLNVMSLFMALGMDLQSVVQAASWNPAQAIHREELGSLSVGAPADVAILNIRQGEFGFRDIYGNKVQGRERLECAATIRAGRVVYDLNGIADTVKK